MYFKYNVEKKQVSMDRGITWEDTSETRLGRPIGAYPDYITCAGSGDTRLEKTTYFLDYGTLDLSKCSPLPSGIADWIKFTAGAICCNTWYWFNAKVKDSYTNHVDELELGQRMCGGGYCPSFKYYSAQVGGREIIETCKYNLTPSYYCTDHLCDCYDITTLMPWAEERRNDNWLHLYSQKWTRTGANKPWDSHWYEPQLVTVAERWIKTSENPNTWQHQVIVLDDDENYHWENEGQPITE